MFMPFDRQHQHPRRAHFASSPDATGTPFTIRSGADHHRPSTAEPRDFREQADGAP